MDGKPIFHTVLVLICTRVVAIVTDRYVVLREAVARTRQFTCRISVPIAVAVEVPGLRGVVYEFVTVVVDLVALLRSARMDARNVVVAVIHVGNIARSGLVLTARVYDLRIAEAILVPVTVECLLDARRRTQTGRTSWSIEIVIGRKNSVTARTTNDGQRHRKTPKALLHRGLLMEFVLAQARHCTLFDLWPDSRA